MRRRVCVMCGIMLGNDVFCHNCKEEIRLRRRLLP